MLWLQDDTWDVQMLGIQQGVVDPSLDNFRVKSQGRVLSCVELLQPHLKIHVLGILGDTNVSHTLILLEGCRHKVVFTDW